MDKVSIILPVYNGEKYIEECIKSLLKQTYENIEIIFVDDGSTDNTQKIIEQYQKKNPHIQYYYQENRRQGTARNNGLSKATGKYVCFIDSDDFIDENMIKEMYNFMKMNDYDIALCDYYIHSKNNNKYVKCYYEEFKDYKNIDMKEYLLSAVSPSNKMFKKEFLIKNNFKFLERSFYEDYATIPTLAKYNPKIGYIPKAYLYYVQSENSTMRKSEYKKSFEEIFGASEFLYNSLKEKKEYKEELEFIFIYHLLHNSSIEFNEYEKYENIKKISKFMKKNYPKWYKNKYLSKESLKFKVICYLFYKNKSNIINLIRKSKNKYGKDSKK